MVSVTEYIWAFVNYVMLEVPDEFGMDSLVVKTQYSDSLSASINNVPTNKYVKMTITEANLELETLTIELVNITNPSATGTNPWKLSYYDSQDVLIAQSVDTYFFDIQCTLPCRSCEADPT